MKIVFSAQTRVVSTTSKRISHYVLPFSTVYVDFHSSNVIYLINCSRYDLQYVWEAEDK